MKRRTWIRHNLTLILMVITLTCMSAAAALAQPISLQGNWNPEVKARLEKLIAANANQGKICVFDFDNTTICRDIGEATMATLNEAGLLTKEKHYKCVDPSFVLGDKKITMETAKNLPMLNRAENRIWITRLEKMGYQETLVKVMKNALPGQWFVQPALYKKAPGFVASQTDLNKRLAAKPEKLAKVNAVVKFLQTNKALIDF